MSEQVTASQKVASNRNELCSTLPEDKATSCEIIIEDHSKMKIPTKEAEKKLSKLVGKEVVLMEEPDWKLLPQDPDTLESWAMAACMMYAKEDEHVQICIDEIDKMVKGEKSLEETSKRIGKMTREDPDEIATTLIETAPSVNH
jgi:hypothetical protein